MTKDTGGPAFPLRGHSIGMSLRDYFAAKAMQTMVSHRWTEFKTNNEEMSDWDYFFEIIAEESYGIADAMLKARTE